MAWIHLDAVTQARADAAATRLGISVSQVLHLAVEQLAQADQLPLWPAEKSVPRSESTRWLKVHCRYMGVRVEGLFDPEALTLRIKTAPWCDEEFPSPTAAAVAVLHEVNPNRASPATNGRRFWTISETGLDLRSLIGKKR